MQLRLFVALAVLAVTVAATVEAAIIPPSPITTTYTWPAVPVATSYQFVARNVNRALASQVPSVSYPGYFGYPHNYRLGYGYGYGAYGHVHNYGYGYPYGFGAGVW